MTWNNNVGNHAPITVVSACIWSSLIIWNNSGSHDKNSVVFDQVWLYETTSTGSHAPYLSDFMKQKGYFKEKLILPDFHFEEAKKLPENFDVAANDNFILLSISESHVDHLQEKGDDCYSNMKDCKCYILSLIVNLISCPRCCILSCLVLSCMSLIYASFII